MKMRPLSYFRRSVVVFPLAALAALAMFVINEISYRDATTSLNALAERSAARGYLLPSRDDYLTPYRDAQEGLHRSIDWLKSHYAGDLESRALVEKLIETSDEKMSELATTIELHDKGADQAWRDLLMSNIGSEKMDRLRELTEQLLAKESTLVDLERKSIYQTLMLNRIGVSAMAAISLLALFMYLRQTVLLEQQ